MTEVSYVWKDEMRNRPGKFVAQITASADAQTVTVNFPIKAAVFQPNRDNAASDSWGVTFTPGEQVATIQLIGTTSLTGTIILYGDA